MSVNDKEGSGSEGAERDLDLSSLFQGLLGQGEGQVSGGGDSAGLGGLLGALLGGGAPEAGYVEQTSPDAAGLAESTGLSPSLAQAALALIMGSLLRGDSGKGSAGGGLAGLLGQPADQPLDEEAVKATGLPEALSHSTGLDLPKAVLTVQQILDWLRKATKPLGSAGAGKPSTSSTTAAKKRRRKTSSATTAKAKPKKTTGSKPAKAKPKKTTPSKPAKAKPKKTSTSKPAKAKPKKTTSSKRTPK